MPEVSRIAQVPANQPAGGAVKLEEGEEQVDVSLPEVLMAGSRYGGRRTMRGFGGQEEREIVARAEVAIARRAEK